MSILFDIISLTDKNVGDSINTVCFFVYNGNGGEVDSFYGSYGDSFIKTFEFFAALFAAFVG